MDKLWEEDTTNRFSILSTNDAISNMESGTTSECASVVIESLRKQVTSLEAELTGLKRAIPRLKDMAGLDFTEKMTEVCTKLAQKESELEDSYNLSARKHTEMERLRSELFRRLKVYEDEVKEATARAKTFEEENRLLRDQIANEQSRIYRLNMQNEDSEDSDTDTMYASKQNDLETIQKIQQELNDRLSEIDAHKSESLKWRTKYEAKAVEFTDLQKCNNQYRKFIDGMLAGDEMKKSFLEKSMAGDAMFSDADYIVANMVALLEMLDSNSHEIRGLRREVVDMLHRHGYTANEANITALSQTIINDLPNCRKMIKQRTLQLQKEIGVDSMMQRHLDALDESTLSATALVSNVSLASTFNEIMKNTTGVGFLNRTVEVSQDLGNVRKQMDALRGVSVQLFEKLRGTAEFLETILETLGETEEGREILKKIQDLRFDLDKSLYEANFVAAEFEKAEKSIVQYCDMMEQVMETSNLVESKLNDNQEQVETCTNAELFEKFQNAEKTIEELRTELLDAKNQKEAESHANAEMLEKFQNAEKTITELRTELLDARNQKETESHANAELLEKFQNAEKTIAELRTELLDAKNQNEAESRANAELLEKFQNAEKIIAELRTELFDAKNQKEAESHANAELLEKFQNAEKIIAELRTELLDAKNVFIPDKKAIKNEIEGELSKIYDTLAAAKETTSKVTLKKKK